MSHFPTFVLRWFGLLIVTIVVYVGLAGAGIAVTRTTALGHLSLNIRTGPMLGDRIIVSDAGTIVEMVIAIVTFVAAVIIAASVVRDWETK